LLGTSHDVESHVPPVPVDALDDATALVTLAVVGPTLELAGPPLAVVSPEPTDTVVEPVLVEPCVAVCPDSAPPEPAEPDAPPPPPTLTVEPQATRTSAPSGAARRAKESIIGTSTGAGRPPRNGRVGSRRSRDLPVSLDVEPQRELRTTQLDPG
jgi:outer membrane biosynthesis protein TonB